MRALFFLASLCAFALYAQSGGDGGPSGGGGEKYEFIDLGKLQIEGEFSTPTDILIQEQAQRNLRQKLYDRKHFRRENFMDIYNLK